MANIRPTVDCELAQYCRERGIPDEQSNHLPQILVRGVSDARHKIGRLLFAGTGSLFALWSMQNPQIVAIIQDPTLRHILQRIFAVSAGYSFGKLLYGRMQFQKWMDHCQLMKDAGLLDRYLQTMLRIDPVIKPLLFETALKLGADTTPFDSHASLQ